MKTKDRTKPLTEEEMEQYKSGLKDVFFRIAIILLVIALAYKIFSPIQFCQVSGESMNPTFQNGQFILCDKRKATKAGLKRGDIVVASTRKTLPFPLDILNGTRLIKRVVGLPGEDISFRLSEEGVVEVIKKAHTETWEQATALDEPYILEPMDPTEMVFDSKTGIALTEEGKPLFYHLEDGEYVILGDNRNNSKDSRYYGKLTTEMIIGKVTVRLKPYTKY